VKSVCAHDVGELARCIALSAGILCCLRGGMGQLFGCGLLGRVVRSAGRDDNSSLICQVRIEEVEEESVADMVDAKGRLYPVISVAEIVGEWDAGVEEQGLDGRMALYSQCWTNLLILERFERSRGRNTTFFWARVLLMVAAAEFGYVRETSTTL
jgi:hypothetical protein